MAGFFTWADVVCVMPLESTRTSLFLVSLSMAMALGCRTPEPPAQAPIMEFPKVVISAEMRAMTVDALSRSTVSGAREVVCAERRHFEHQLQDLMTELEVAVGLTGLQPGLVEVLDEQTFAQSAELWFARHRSPDVLRAEGRAFRGMGLLHPKFDYAAAVRELSLTGLVSFYDEQERKVYMRQGDVEAPEWRSSLAIAFTHALVDQHHGLTAFLGETSGDSMLARLAVLDGAAVSLWLDVEHGVVGVDEAYARLERLEKLQRSQEIMARMPPFMERLVLFPHFVGARFIYARMAADDTAEGRERASFFADAPQSTASVMLPMVEQTHHTLEAELPLDALGEFEPKTPEYEASLGVFGLRAWLEIAGKRTDAIQLTQGWRGDRLWSFKRGESNMLLLHVSLWSTEAEAQAFQDSLDVLFKFRYHRKHRYFTETARDGRVVAWLEGLIGENGKQDVALRKLMKSVRVDGEPLQ